MNRNEILREIEVICRDVFEEETLAINEQMTSEDIEEWDSLGQMNLIDAIEAKFKMKFSIQDIKEFNSIGSIVDLVLRKLTREC